MTMHAKTSQFSVVTPKGTPSFIARLRLIGATHQQRKQLAALGLSALNDIGITEAQAKTESRRPAWDVPANWRR